MTEEWGQQPTQANPTVIPNDSVPRAVTFVPVIIVLVLVAGALFGLGYWLAPNAPSQLNQVKNCAGLNDDLPGYSVKITDPAGKALLDVPCDSTTPTVPAKVTTK